MSSPVITYVTYDILTNTLLSELQIKNVNWANRLNGGGSFSGQIPLADRRNPNQAILDSTQPGRTILLAIVDGTVEWAGVIWSRSYTRSSAAIDISGLELDSYLDKIQQAGDYGSHWPGFLNSTTGTTVGTTLTITYNSTTKHWITNPIPPIMSMLKVVGDSLKSNYDHVARIPNLSTSGTLLNAAVKAHMVGGYPNGSYWTDENYPRSSRTSLAAMLTQASSQSSRSGFDYAVNVDISSGSPVYSIDLTYPRQGFDSVGSTGIPGSITTGISVVDGAEVLDYTYPEDASGQFTRIFASSGATKGHRLSIGDFSTGTTWSGNNVWFADRVPVGTTITVYHDGSSTPNTGIVRHITWNGPVYGYLYKIEWSGGTPAWIATPLKSCSFLLAGGPSDVGYPPLQETVSYSETKTQVSLRRASFGDLSAQEWPIVNPTITVDAMGPSGIKNVTVGDDIRISITPDDRFPDGLDAYWRVVQIDVSIQDGQTVTATYALNVPPNSNVVGGGFPANRPPS